MESPAGSGGPDSATGRALGARTSRVPTRLPDQAPARRVVSCFALRLTLGSIKLQIDRLDDRGPAGNLIIQKPAYMLWPGIGARLESGRVKHLLQLGIGKARA